MFQLQAIPTRRTLCACLQNVVGPGVYIQSCMSSWSIRCILLQVYSWFLGCHKACVVIGVLGYGLLILEGIGLGLLFGPMWPDGISLMLVWYGLYFGVLGRDLAEVAGDRMVSHGYSRLHNHLAFFNVNKHCLRLTTCSFHTCVCALSTSWLSVHFCVCGTDNCEVWSKSCLAVQVATMGTRRKLSVSVNNCGICGGVLKVGDQIHASFMLSMQQPVLFPALHSG